MENKEKRQRIEALREKLEQAGGKGHWRGVEELEGSEEFQAWLDDEFLHRAEMSDVDRRTFLKVMGASLALAGLAGCRSLPEERIVPYVTAPEERLPGEILYYASAMPFGGYGLPLVVTSNEGRPTKIEGNDRFAPTDGATDPFTQAEILQMYDPDRSTIPTRIENGQTGLPVTWEVAMGAMRDALISQKANKGATLRMLTETVTSPTLYAQIKEFLAAYPQAKWYQYEAANRDNERLGSLNAFGKMYDTHYHFENAMVVVSLDGDFLDCTPNHVAYIRAFARNRDPDKPMSRLYAIESTYSITGACADHRLAVKPSDLESVAAYIVGSLQAGLGGQTVPVPTGTGPWLDAMVKDLQANRVSAVVTCGPRASANTQAWVHVANSILSAPQNPPSATVTYSDPIEPEPAIQYQQLAELTKEMNEGAVDTLIIFGGNPAFTAPPDIPFAAALQKMTTAGKSTFHHSHYEDETAVLCGLHLPESHFLESWGDLRAIDGTIALQQPLIAPLYDSRSAIEMMSGLLNKPDTGRDLVRKTWAKLNDDDWRKALESGFIPATAATPVVAGAPKTPPAPAAPSQGIEAVFAPDTTVWDGRYANNGWLQELPKPITRLSWDNAVVIGPKMATQLGVEYQDMVTLTANGATVSAPVYMLPGLPDDTITLHFGYGRKVIGKVGDKTGFDFNPLRNSANSWTTPIQITKGDGVYDFAMAQIQQAMDNRDIVREGSLDEYKKDQTLKPADEPKDDDADILYNLTAQWADENPDLPQWGMSIDLSACTGCGACEIACQAENNISTVGKPQVQKGRIMHWIRVDRYFRVDDQGKERDFHEPIAEVEAISMAQDSDPVHGAMNANNVKIVHMPVPCMHCETAPCEPVCPVAATIHSHEGLNQMVYNRCVGTRYCSNNCPYKVRRFNFFNFEFRQPQFQSERDITLLNLLNNPDVTVRSRGVMEKCSYCVQRINAARINAKKEDRPIRDGEITPACAQACPSKAIMFGNIASPTSRVSVLKAKKRNYSLLADLNTRPRTTYLVKVRNLNPEISKLTV